MMTHALNAPGAFPWIEPQLPSYYSCRLSPLSKLDGMNLVAKGNALTKGPVGPGLLDPDQRVPIVLNAAALTAAQDDSIRTLIRTMFEDCRNGVGAYGVDAAVEFAGSSFLQSETLPVYKSRRAVCSFDAKALQKPLSYCDRVIYKSNPTTTTCTASFDAQYVRYESFNLCPQSECV